LSKIHKVNLIMSLIQRIYEEARGFSRWILKETCPGVHFSMKNARLVGTPFVTHLRLSTRNIKNWIGI